MISGLNHLTLAVIDLSRSFAFYHDILGFKPLCRWNKGAYFLAGDLWFCLNVDPLRVPNTCYTHYAFTVSPEEFEPLQQRIIDSGTTIFKENNSPGLSFYFLDPDGHKLELHSGGWHDRIEAKKREPGSWKEVEWFV